MKILVSLAVPAISERYDVLLPNTVRIKKLVTMIAETVEILSNQRYIATGNEYLCFEEKNIQLIPNSTLEHYGIQNGSHLMII